jgi:nucleotide-binding universal stress UspA family protein
MLAWVIPTNTEETAMHVLIGVDGSQAAEVACEFVGNRTWPIGTRVELVGVISHELIKRDRIAARDALRQTLDDRGDSLRRASMTVSTEIIDGDPAESLVARAGNTFADLIVVGNRGLGPVGSAVLGSASAHLIDHAPCPVLVARSPTATRMVLASDGTYSSRKIPRILAAWQPAFSGMPVEVVSVASPEKFLTPWAPEGDTGRDWQGRDIVQHRQIAEQVADELMDLGWHSAAIVAMGDPAREILDASRDWHADLIVTGSRGIGTIRRLLEGSVAHKVMMHARSSVLVMRGQVPARIQSEALAIRPAFG